MSALPDTPDANTVLALLRKLPAKDRLRLIATALPETEREIAATTEAIAGSSEALLALFDQKSMCEAEDVDAWVSAIEAGKRPVRSMGLFDSESPVH